MKKKLLNFLKKKPKEIALIILTILLLLMTYLFVSERSQRIRAQNAIMRVFESDEALRTAIERRNFVAKIKPTFGL